MNYIKFDASWAVDGEEDETDVADILISVGDQVFTRVFDGEVRDYIRASPLALASWLTTNWWRLRYEPYPDKLVPPTEWRFRHELTSVSGGTLWPPIMIYGEGTRVVFGPRLGSWKVTSPVRFYNDASVASVDGGPYEVALDRFFDKVLGRCVKSDYREALSLIVATLKRERLDEEIAAWRRLEAQLGFDMDEAPEPLMRDLEAYQQRYGKGGVGEAAMAAPGLAAADVITQAVRAAQVSSAVVKLDVARTLTSAGARPTSELEPWRLAELAAAELRKCVNAKHGPISDAALSDMLGVRQKDSIDASATAASLPYAVLLKRDPSFEAVALQSRPNSRPRRFELARALGDAAWLGKKSDSDDTFAPISNAKSDRQKFQRAFAQSLLCPFDDLMEFLGTDELSKKNINEACVHFDVSRLVVDTVLVNKDVLPRETLDSKLEAA